MSVSSHGVEKYQKRDMISYSEGNADNHKQKMMSCRRNICSYRKGKIITVL